MTSGKTSLLVLHNIMAPYRFPLFKAIANQPDIDLTVWFMSRSAKNRRWRPSTEELGFNYEVLPGIGLNFFSRDLFTYIVNYDFPLRYARRPFDVLISAGWLDFACQAGFFTSKLLKRKFVLWSESTSYEPSWRRSLAAPLVRTIVRGADMCVSVGTRSREYLCELGAKPAKIFTAYSTVDVTSFQITSAAARPHRIEYRTRLGIARRYVLLYCGQFIERKGLQYLLEAFVSLKRHYEDVALVLVGYGHQRTDLLQEVARLRVPDVHMLDHVEVNEMPKIYALADVFVLPSVEETWGLVVNEAMACGLPVIVTERVGSSVDLVRDGENGYVIPAADPASLASRILGLLTDPPLLERMSSASAERIRQFTPERAALAFVDAVHAAMG